ncbi:HD domain-containing phosphohydrolase [Roseimaritima ulvae]|uniref:Cyclic di-GMP phosphodiesterase response regulator RpfG n=1 Tax=Roseimaritima ulvae TaxID=980254 RepID=A0A5B9QG77_9BACT|nr:HD domain-containing phosphohydrolase [Roseimaritima ulvae]QEG38067.1 Cyclic di-GMP phosphodiesterase response regulator RpfG [Roseimaritima ulvae]
MSTADPISPGNPPQPTVGLAAAGNPNRQNAAPATAVRAQETKPPAITAAKVLILDDEMANVRVLKRFLESAGYTNIQTSTDSTTAMGWLEQQRPDLLLLDVMMPDVSGIDLLGQIRQHPRLRFLPVLIVTANTDNETKRTCLSLGATDFLAKPVDPNDLLPRVRNTLVTRSFQNQLARYAQQLEQRVKDRTRELEFSRREVVECLARAAEYRDTETGNHVVRVGRFAGIIAKRMGFTADEVSNIELAAQLHDVGKIAIPDAVLHKPGRLDPDEFAYIKRHAAIGHSIIRAHSPRETEALRRHVMAGGQLLAAQSSPLLRLASTIALSHHERWDGTGYPLGLKGEDIPPEARITSVADVYDALSSARPYKDAMPREKCFQILEEGRGTQFDPRVLDAFFESSEEVIQVQLELVDVPPVD